MAHPLSRLPVFRSFPCDRFPSLPLRGLRWRRGRGRTCRRRERLAQPVDDGGFRFALGDPGEQRQRAPVQRFHRRGAVVDGVVERGQGVEVRQRRVRRRLQRRNRSPAICGTVGSQLVAGQIRVGGTQLLERIRRQFVTIRAANESEPRRSQSGFHTPCANRSVTFAARTSREPCRRGISEGSWRRSPTPCALASRASPRKQNYSTRQSERSTFLSGRWTPRVARWTPRSGCWTPSSGCSARLLERSARNSERSSFTPGCWRFLSGCWPSVQKCWFLSFDG